MQARILSFHESAAKASMAAGRSRLTSPASADAAAAAVHTGTRGQLIPYTGDSTRRWRQASGSAAAYDVSQDLSHRDDTTGGVIDRDTTRRPSQPKSGQPKSGNFKFWRGASGQSYVHSTYGLITCPDLPRSVVVLSRRAASETASVPLAVMRLENDAGCLNLARVRQLGATLGANEVHVHVLSDSPATRRLTERDLSAGLLGAVHARLPC